MPAKKKSLIRVGVLGQGRSGLDIHCRYFKTASRKFQIVAVSDLLRDRRQRAENEIGCATYANYRDLIAREDLDLVVNAVGVGFVGLEIILGIFTVVTFVKARPRS